MKEFYTRESSNEGVKLPLQTPDGKESPHWLRIRGADSDQFRNADVIAKRGVIEISQIEDAQAKAEAIRKSEVTVIASLIADWSFDKACTQSNIIEFLTEAPQIADAVNRFAGNRTNFFKVRSQNSSTGTEVK